MAVPFSVCNHSLLLYILAHHPFAGWMRHIVRFEGARRSGEMTH